jgi:hypothetical protein
MSLTQSVLEDGILTMSLTQSLLEDGILTMSLTQSVLVEDKLTTSRTMGTMDLTPSLVARLGHIVSRELCLLKLFRVYLI